MNVTLIVAFGFFVLGILIKFGKMYFLIAGLNTMSDEQRGEYNLEKIGNLFLKVCTSISIFIALGYLIGYIIDNVYVEFVFLFVAAVVGMIVLLVKLNSESYRRIEE